MSINKAILIGNVGRDPDIRYLERENEKKNAVATFTLATTERGYTLANGTQVPERTEWHNIVAWRGLAELAEKYIRKGSQLYIEGKITTRSWEKEGVTRYTTEIVADTIQLLGSRRQDGQSDQPATGNAGKASSPVTTEKKTVVEPDMPATGASEDDLPF